MTEQDREVENSEAALPQRLLRPLSRWIWYIVPLGIVAAVGVLLVVLRVAAPLTTVPAGPAQGERVRPGGDYYVLAALIELAAEKPNGGRWDANGSAPDVYYEILWKGQRVHESSVKEDTLLAKWSTTEIDLRGLAITGRSISVDDTIQAARINVVAGETLRVRVFDKDVGMSDLAAEIELPTTELRVGDAEYKFAGQGVARMVLRVGDMNQSVDMLR